MGYNRSIPFIYYKLRAIKGASFYKDRTTTSFLINFKRIKIIENLKFINKVLSIILNIIKLRPIYSISYLRILKISFLLELS